MILGRITGSTQTTNTITVTGGTQTTAAVSYPFTYSYWQSGVYTEDLTHGQVVEGLMIINPF